jgi:acyl-coenzyme A thioesterase PaaI-like protein|tara:strand:- start:861 stop:1274 length:414 start_codon:yes stop_codon:yes gene_type:complete
MNKDLKNIFNEIPDFLAILGFQDAYLDENDEWVIEFLPTRDLTHSNGTIVQGGFVSGMIDASMSQLIMFLSNGKDLPLTLDLDVKFLKSCIPNVKAVALSKIVRKGKSIIFTSGELYQNDELIATGTATNKIININP